MAKEAKNWFSDEDYYYNFTPVKFDEFCQQLIKEQIDELELKLYVQKLHCKLFHRQKISIWFMNIYYKLKWWIKPIKIE